MLYRQSVHSWRYTCISELEINNSFSKNIPSDKTGFTSLFPEVPTVTRWMIQMKIMNTVIMSNFPVLCPQPYISVIISFKPLATRWVTPFCNQSDKGARGLRNSKCNYQPFSATSLIKLTMSLKKKANLWPNMWLSHFNQQMTLKAKRQTRKGFKSI
mgnify:CR=1 FL=1